MGIVGLPSLTACRVRCLCVTLLHCLQLFLTRMSSLCIYAADHYGSAEIIFGQFRQACIAGFVPTTTSRTPPALSVADGDRSHSNREEQSVEANGSADTGNGHICEPMTATAVPICADKWCIFRNPSPPLTLQTTEEAVRERMLRTGIADGIDILQVHWHDYSQPQVYLDVFRQLLELRGSRGASRRLRIDVLGLVNFDSKRVNEICEAMGPGEILTNQVQVIIKRSMPFFLHALAVVYPLRCVVQFFLYPFSLFLDMFPILVPFAAPLPCRETLGGLPIFSACLTLPSLGCCPTRGPTKTPILSIPGSIVPLGIVLWPFVTGLILRHEVASGNLSLCVVRTFLWFPLDPTL